MESRKMIQMNLFAGQEWKWIYREQICGWEAGQREGWDESGDWNWHIYIFTTATAKSLQSSPTLYDPIDGSPPGSPVPGILQARILKWVAIAFSNIYITTCKIDS